MTCLKNLSHQARIPFRQPTEDKKCPFYLKCIKNLQQKQGWFFNPALVFIPILFFNDS